MEPAWVSFIQERKDLLVYLQDNELEVKICRVVIAAGSGVGREVFVVVEKSTVESYVEEEVFAEPRSFELDFGHGALEVVDD